jgi:hypothetical protein
MAWKEGGQKKVWFFTATPLPYYQYHPSWALKQKGLLLCKWKKAKGKYVIKTSSYLFIGLALYFVVYRGDTSVNIIS